LGVPGTVGIIANPASGRDIRRLVAGATTVSDHDKVTMLRRLLQGLSVAGVERLLVMPDQHGLARQALDTLAGEGHPVPPVEWLGMTCDGSAGDSTRAGALLREAQAGCVLILGGDGTARAVARSAGETPLLPLSTGTNNVLPSFTEATVAGLAAGAVARRQVCLQRTALRHKWLEVLTPGRLPDLALVDLALLRGRFAGSKAVWEAEELRELVVTRADPATIGLSAIAGVLRPVAPEDSFGLAVTLDATSPRRVLAPFGPGLPLVVGIAAVREIRVGETVRLMAQVPSMVALDGEREFGIAEGQVVEVRLRSDGPWIVDSSRVLREMVRLGLLERPWPSRGG